MADTEAQGHGTATEDAKVANYITCNTTTQASACKPSARKLRSRWQQGILFPVRPAEKQN